MTDNNKNIKQVERRYSMCDYDDPDDSLDSETAPEESWMDYMDEGDISGNGPDDDNYDPA